MKGLLGFVPLKSIYKNLPCAAEQNKIGASSGEHKEWRIA
jgi:hypothetical protein